MRYSLLLMLLLAPSVVSAQTGTAINLGGGITTFSDSTGTTGTIMDLGGGMRTYSDSSGRTGVITDLGGGVSTYNINPPARIAPAAPRSGGHDLGNLTVNPYAPDSLANPYGAGSQFKADGLNNPYSEYGSQFSNKSPNNPFATDAPKLYDQQGNYRGRLGGNPYGPDSTSNPYGRYGSQFSPDSINNPYGAGNRFAPDSPKNPYGLGWKVEGSK